jgi:hypothetical protein
MKEERPSNRVGSVPRKSSQLSHTLSEAAGLWRIRDGAPLNGYTSSARPPRPFGPAQPVELHSVLFQAPSLSDLQRRLGQFAL